MNPILIPIALLATAFPAARQDSFAVAMRAEARAAAPRARTKVSQAFLNGMEGLPKVGKRTLHFDEASGQWFSNAELTGLPDSIRERIRPRIMDEAFFYRTRHGSAVTYVLPLDIVAEAGVKSLDGRRVLDFEYGAIGPLRLLARLGATVVGVGVDSMLRALYSESGDQGPVPGPRNAAGSVRLIHGRFPGDAATGADVGGDYDLVLAMNVLRGGHEPEERTRQRQVVDLGVSDSAFVAEVFARLQPGGHFLVYNLSGPNGNGRCPFPEAMLKAAGFEVRAFDRDDTPAARGIRGALRTAHREPPPDRKTVPKATYTLARRPGSR